MRRRVLLVGYRDADGLDLFGPAEVFAEAVLRLEAPVYEVVMSAVGGGVVTLTSGISVATADLTDIRPQPNDIVIVAGEPTRRPTLRQRTARCSRGWRARPGR